ncbi:MAG: hypothetical protein JW828_05770 [Sedimentisphaerales bacterium]|nr:hypothetical protein [Sedimentisphaerales bacterium]
MEVDERTERIIGDKIIVEVKVVKSIEAEHVPKNARPVLSDRISNPGNPVHRVKTRFFFVDEDTNRYTSIGGHAITHDEADYTTEVPSPIIPKCPLFSQ